MNKLTLEELDGAYEVAKNLVQDATLFLISVWEGSLPNADDAFQSLQAGLYDVHKVDAVTPYLKSHRNGPPIQIARLPLSFSLHQTACEYALHIWAEVLSFYSDIDREALIASVNELKGSLGEHGVTKVAEFVRLVRKLGGDVPAGWVR